MAVGAPDWLNRLWRQEVTLRQDQLYPTGKVLFADAFDSPVLSWETGGVGTETAEILTTSVLSAPGCVHLRTGIGAADTAYIQKVCGVGTGKKIGVQLSFDMLGADPLYYFEVNYSDGTNLYSTGIQHDTSDTTWKYKNSAGVYTNLSPATKFIYIAGVAYHRLKLALDFSTGKYVSLNVDESTWDLSSHAIQTTAPGGAQRLITTFTVKATAGMSYPHMYIDNVFITEE